jgi:hypothetical protein
MASDWSGSADGWKSLAYGAASSRMWPVRRIVVDAQLYLAPELVLSSSVPEIALAITVGRTWQLLEVVPGRRRRLELLLLVELLHCTLMLPSQNVSLPSTSL